MRENPNLRNVPSLVLFLYLVFQLFNVNAQSLSVLHVIDNPASPSVADSMVQARLSSLGLHVILADDDTVTSESASGMYCIIIEESCTSSKAEGKFKEVAIPIINMEPFSWDIDCYVDTTDALSFGWTPGPSDFYLEINQLHPISAHWGTGDQIKYYAGFDSSRNKLNWGIPAGDGVSVVEIPEMGRSVLFAYDTGNLMANEFIAPEKRIAFYLQKNVADSLTDDGWILLYTALDWCLSPSRATDTTRIILFNESTEWRMNGGEVLAWQRLLNQGFDVTSSTPETFFSTNWQNFDCAIIQSSCPPNQVPSQYMASIPILNSQAHAYTVNSAWILNSESDIISTSTDALVLEALDHSIAAGLSGTVEITGQDVPLDCVQDPAGLPEIIASSNGNPALFSYEIESWLLSTYRLNHRYVGFPLISEDLKYATSNLWDLWDASVQWLLLPGQSGVSDYTQVQPQKVTLNPAYPNPFNNSTQFSYYLPYRTEIQINVYDALGRYILQLTEGVQEAGEHSLVFDASDLSSGTYFCRLSGESIDSIQKVVLIK
ncbi:T9SS type A sorting domain-containing protein [candidate division KSB1 bacterium]|nr:T9SS type A sorting domain-containing protein [candidate division KSB1 bacterium]